MAARRHPLLGLLCLPPLLAGCIVHRASLASDEPPAVADKGFTALGTRLAPGAPAAADQHGPLPIELAATRIWRAPDGRLWRADARLATPEPWWDHFPCDLAADLWPGEVSAAASVRLSPQPMPARDIDALIAEAKDRGYAE